LEGREKEKLERTVALGIVGENDKLLQFGTYPTTQGDRDERWNVPWTYGRKKASRGVKEEKLARKREALKFRQRAGKKPIGAKCLRDDNQNEFCIGKRQTRDDDPREKRGENWKRENNPCIKVGC